MKEHLHSFSEQFLVQHFQQQDQDAIDQRNCKNAFCCSEPVGIDVHRKQGNVCDHTPGAKEGDQAVFVFHYIQKITKGVKREAHQVDPYKH